MIRSRRERQFLFAQRLGHHFGRVPAASWLQGSDDDDKRV